MTQILLINLILAISQPAQSQLAKQNIPSDISITNSDVNGLTFQCLFPEENIKQDKININNAEYYVFNLPYAGRTAEPGMLDVPSREIIIGIPQQGDISISAQVNSETYYNNVELAPVPYKTWEGEVKYNLVQKVKSTLYPEQICEIKEISYFRNIRIARIKIYPLQYDLSKKQVKIASDITVSVRFSKPAQINPRADYFNGVAYDILLNGSSALDWKREVQNLNINSGYSKYPAGFLNWYKIKIESTGVYKISFNELKNAGVPVNSIDPRTIRLFNIANCTSNVYYPDTLTEIPIKINGEADSSFDRNDYILFYGVSSSRYDLSRTTFYHNPFTKYNYYWLTWGYSTSLSGFGKRFEPVSRELQNNRIYSAENYVRLEKDRDCPARNGLLWIWEHYTKDNNATSQTFNLALDINNPESLYYFSSRFYSSLDSNWIKISLNSQLLDSFFFRGQSSVPPAYDFTINQHLLLNPTNNLSFTLYTPAGHIQSSEDGFFDYINIRYSGKLEFTSAMRDLYFYSQPGNYDFAVRKIGNKPLIIDITDYQAPKIFTNYTQKGDTIVFSNSFPDTCFYYVTDETKARSVLSVEKRNPGQTVSYSNMDYIIVVPDELYESSLLFENYRKNNLAGISQPQVKSIPLSKIYDDYTFGIEEPGAIKRLFKKYQPYYGLLLGDGTYDYRNILELANFPACPAYEQGYDIDFQVYSAAALAVDAWYADFDGIGSSPDMALGRITARTSSEVKRFYDKLVNYENTNATGLWNKRFLFLSDDEWKGQGSPDEFGFEHVSNNENIENQLFISTNNHFRQYEPVKVYLTEYPFSESRDKRKAREALLAELSKGVSLWCFFGHGAGFQLCHEQALHISHVPLVTTNRKNFIGFYGSCGVGRFEDTKYESVAEELVRKQDAGIAAIAASKATYSFTNYTFANLFFNRVITQPDSTIGPAFLRSAFIDYYYHLFGDPATVPALPKNFTTITSSPDTFNAGQIIHNQADAMSNQKYAMAAYSTQWRRLYTSELGTISYNLPGYDIFRAMGNIINDSIKFNFTVPLGLPRQARYDIQNGGGSYTEIPNSARVTGIAHNDNQIFSYLNDSIAFDTLTVTSMDITGPKILLYNGDRRIKPDDNLPAQFTLTGIMQDSSGIMTVPIAGLNPKLIIKKRPNQIIREIDLTPYFNYDMGNFYQGSFSYPTELDTGVNIIVIKATDNLRNTSSESVTVQVAKNQRLAIDNILYYSTEGARAGYFTFTLSQNATVSIKIYTINGRLVKTIADRPCGFGYNQIIWDGWSENGVIPANGVYLYKIQARSYERGNEERASAIEKFIIFK